MKLPLLIACCATWLFGPLAWAQAEQALPSATVQRIMQSVVAVQTRSDQQANTARTLGQQRLGSGVVIAADTVLTIGYLLLEAETVDLVDHQGRRVPGQVRAVDNASGLGLIRALVPLRLEAVPWKTLDIGPKGVRADGAGAGVAQNLRRRMGIPAGGPPHDFACGEQLEWRRAV